LASLRELQRSFAGALREPDAACPVAPAANLSVYRNNLAIGFRSALGNSFPVVHKRVGEDYFRQLASQYRARFPSRSGDLQWVGRHFPAFLREHLAGSDYAWLADLAQLEWARELASVARVDAVLTADVLAKFPAEGLEHLVFTMQPSLSLVASDFPIFTVWHANQLENAPPVDQSAGEERGMVLSRIDGIDVRVLGATLFSYICALARGAPLGEAVTVAGFDQAALVSGLGFVFSEGLVCSVKMGH
jgi:hypothetical protein